MTVFKAKNIEEASHHAMSRIFHSIEKFNERVLQDDDLENLHHLRITIRKLDVLLATYSLSLNLPSDLKEKRIKEISCILGEVRSIDILLVQLKDYYTSDLPVEEKKHLKRIIAILSSQREKAFSKVVTYLKGKKYNDFKNDFNQWLKEPSYNKLADIKIDYFVPALLLNEINKLLLHEGWLSEILHTEGLEFGTIDNLTDKKIDYLKKHENKKLHDLRKQARKIRYQMEFFKGYYNQNYQEYLFKMTECQNIIGNIHDTFILFSVVERIMEDKIEHKLPYLHNQFKITLLNDWKKWDYFRLKFFEQEYRIRFYESIIKLSKR